MTWSRLYDRILSCWPLLLFGAVFGVVFGRLVGTWTDALVLTVMTPLLALMGEAIRDATAPRAARWGERVRARQRERRR